MIMSNTKKGNKFIPRQARQGQKGKKNKPFCEKMTSSKEETTTAEGAFDRGVSAAQGVLGKLFTSCEGDAKGAVHKVWGIILILVVVDFIVSIVEMINIQAYGGSLALVIGSVWTGIVHVVLAILGTFVLKRFPTSFSLGFLMGVILILANQNLIIFATFHAYPFGRSRTNHIYANLSLILFLVLAFFGLLLAHFKEDVTVATIDPKGLNGGRSTTSDTEGQ